MTSAADNESCELRIMKKWKAKKFGDSLKIVLDYKASLIAASKRSKRQVASVIVKKLQPISVGV
ncbi:hypothetical protein EJP67_33395 [Variovorax guangxiensis]|uniref:Uncharacterized protein n=1 Tax=Variovorax guangxiensis TaxID=1775474 RepID=A0A3S0XXJ3_9BURK|nr:hypothetical protein [Variovorax guangxiensis]RUR71953.1 hypothetical protein EJP67_33395 [Variovorax guangxiensis]